MKKLLTAGFLVAALMGCSSNRVIVDTKGVDMSRYTTDLQECETYAAQVPVGEEVAKGAVRGGAVWGAIGAIFGNSRGAARGAGAGAVAGGAKGGANAEREQQQVVKTCMRGRGYKVLN
jgi:outer membrane lipoprotein SlyB